MSFWYLWVAGFCFLAAFGFDHLIERDRRRRCAKDDQ